jgi:hypothetical protein
MKDEFCVGTRVYFVPKCGKSPAQYVPVTRVHSSLKQPLLTLGGQLVIAPALTPDGQLARDKAGSFWITKEAFEAAQAARRTCKLPASKQRLAQGGRFQLSALLNGRFSAAARAFVRSGARFLPKWRLSGRSANS